MEHARKARQFCLTLAAVLTGVLVMAPAQGHGKARQPQPQWEWQVAVGGAGLNLVGDGGGDYTDTGNDLVRVYKDTRNKYRFRLHIWNDNAPNGPGRQVGLQAVTLFLGPNSLCYDPGPGVAIDLPKVDASRLEDKPRVIQLALDGEGRIYLDGQPVARADLDRRFQVAAAPGRPAPELHLRADRGTRYERVTDVMAAAQKAGIAKIAFVTEPAR